MEEALRRAGLSGRSIMRGQIYWVKDDLITLPKTRLPGQPKRNEHDSRPVLVLQTDADNCSPNCVSVLVAPVSTRVDLQEITDYKLSAGQGGLLKDSVVLLGLIQPMLKIHLAGGLGRLDSITMEDIDAIVAANLGLTERPPT